MPRTLLADLRRTLVEPWPSQPLGKRRGACGLQRIAHPPADAPVPQLPDRLPSPCPPQLLYYFSYYLFPSFLHDPTRLDGLGGL